MRRRTRRGLLGVGGGAMLWSALPGMTAASAGAAGQTTVTPAALAPVPAATSGSVKDFGAVGNGVANDTAAVSAALAKGGAIYFPAGTYQVGNLKAIREGTRLYGDGPSTVLRKNATGPVLTLANSRISVDNLIIDGVGGVYGGPGIVSQGVYPHLTGMEIRETREPSLAFPTTGAGHSAIVSDCLFSVWQGQFGETNDDTATVSLPDDHNPTQASNRQFANIHANACLLFADAGSENSKWVECTGRSVVITGRPAKLLMSACRLASSGEPITLNGMQCAVTGNAFAGDVVLNMNASTFVGNVVAGKLTITKAATQTSAGLNAAFNGVVDQR
jgi:hypothetical protein